MIYTKIYLASQQERIRMAEPRKVNIRIVSKAGSQVIEERVQGSLYMRNGHIYIRYEEPVEQMGHTSTIVKIDAGEIKIIRRGDIVTDQSFVAGRHTHSDYATPETSMKLSMFTHKIETRLSNGIGVVEWSYDLYVSGDLAGTYAIQMDIRED
jgi:uncharacterized beta-barrel protein YwiB (DUF1934 family)